MEQGIVYPFVPYPSVGKKGDSVYLVTSGAENASGVQGSGSFFPVPFQNECEVTGNEHSLGIILLGSRLEGDFDILLWSRWRLEF